MSRQHQVIEAILFLENTLVDSRKLARHADMEPEELDQCIEELNSGYTQAGSVLKIVKLESAYRFSINSDFDDPVLEKYAGKKKKISKALMETLAIIAYKQPVTKAEVDDIRGVNCGNYIKLLSDDGLIKIAGKKDAPGKPWMYRTTSSFLAHFGLGSLKDLPSIKEVKTFDFLEIDEDDTIE